MCERKGEKQQSAINISFMAPYDHGGAADMDAEVRGFLITAEERSPNDD
ncbi:protein of unknown function [Bacillus velezensis]|nr:protein of unknown function [Bacillus velezensis]